MDRASISIIVDHLAVARGWSDAMAARRANARRADQSRRRLPSLRHRSRTPPARSISSAVSRAAGSAAARAAQPRRPRLSRDVGRGARGDRRARRGRDPDDAARAGGGGRASRSTKLSVGATPTLRFSARAAAASPSCGPATTCTSTARRSRSAPRRSTTARSRCWRPSCRSRPRIASSSTAAARR